MKELAEHAAAMAVDGVGELGVHLDVLGVPSLQMPVRGAARVDAGGSDHHEARAAPSSLRQIVDVALGHRAIGGEVGLVRRYEHAVGDRQRTQVDWLPEDTEIGGGHRAPCWSWPKGDGRNLLTTTEIAGNRDR